MTRVKWRMGRAAAMATMLGLAAVGLANAQNAPAGNTGQPGAKAEESLVAREVRHQIQVLPFTSVFDNIVTRVDGGKVTLTGQVVRPMLKAQAEAAVKSIEGVGRVVNEIEVLPASASDDELRRGIYRAIYEDAVLQKYAVIAMPAIHVVVKNGNVALEGFVESEPDKKQAEARAKGVANVGSVKNNLVLRAKESSKGK